LGKQETLSSFSYGKAAAWKEAEMKPNHLEEEHSTVRCDSMNPVEKYSVPVPTSTLPGEERGRILSRPRVYILLL
jgi:hypothetical protein